MKLLNDFYTRNNWKQDDSNISCDIVFNPQHDIFKGHFPEHPVVPGVCTMSFIKKALEDALNQKLILKEAGAVKFLQLILPDHHVTMNIKFQQDEKGISAQTSLLNEGKPAFKMNALYQAQL